MSNAGAMLKKRLVAAQEARDRKEAVKRNEHFKAVTAWHAKVQLAEQDYIRNRQQTVMKEELEQATNELRIARRVKLKHILQNEMIAYKRELSAKGVVLVSEDMTHHC
mmetsp:Transcript_13284/g.24080  ORF Transcript_13284/g.24080 Transcript_13284/m.24080 type:complete len:108 (+) Transcript_13284:183-506(+)|eukprot:CAMPEP_0197523434 /NCGR_PEP_ID=MMETSP1318-20131121/8362_1 /TAXON_ID=552666 /ORGANISM="Partenskyella glossopodia, Strain RCC365" /LENGTH=107 /DNA_ID=CAMNT_0043076123 /DNA_START=193 /DNA_END=516 /DNA_ORIENTATION=+